MADKKALVLSGGGAKGSFEIGVWKALLETGFDPEVITGTSVGALNGAAVAMGDFDRAYEMWQSIETNEVLDIGLLEKTDEKQTKKQLVKKALKGGSDPLPLKKLISKYINEDQIRSLNKDFGIVTVSLSPIKSHCLFLDEIKKGKLVDYLVASSSFFPFIKLCQFDGKGFIDGGFYDNMPVNMAVNRGAREIVCVDLKAPGLRHPIPRKDDLNIKVISPSADLGKLFLFSPTTSKQNIELGYLDARRSLGSLEGSVFAFETGESEKNIKTLEKAVNKVLARIGIDLSKKAATHVEYLSRIILLKRLRKIQNNCTGKALINALAQEAGLVFCLDRLKIYNFNEFNRELIEKYKEVEAEGKANSIFSNASFDSVLKLFGDEKKLDKEWQKEIVPYFIKNILSGGQNTAKALPSITILPTEFGAAIYICALFETVNC